MIKYRIFMFAIIGSLFTVSSPIVADDEENEKVKWHEAILSKTKSSLGNVEEFADIQWRRFSNQMGFNEPRHIAAYRGYGNDKYLWVQGRLLGNKPFGGPGDDDNWWDNLQATYQRWESDEITEATMLLTYGDQTIEVETDNEGYYQARFDIDQTYPRTDVVIAQHRLDDRVLTATHNISLLDPNSEFMVISDVDDTVIHTGITDLLLAAQLTFLHNAKTRKPLTGVGGLYQSLSRGMEDRPVNPVFYLSNSAWNMYDLLRDFMDLNDLPFGPLLLRDIGINSDSSTHKIDSLRLLLDRYPDLPVILVGDSGQHDASIYAEVAAENPGRIKAIYIRDVDPESDSEYDGSVDAIIEKSREIGVPFLRVQDSEQIAQHASTMGILPSDEVEDIADDVAADKQRETLAEKADVPNLNRVNE